MIGPTLELDSSAQSSYCASIRKNRCQWHCGKMTQCKLSDMKLPCASQHFESPSSQQMRCMSLPTDVTASILARLPASPALHPPHLSFHPLLPFPTSFPDLLARCRMHTGAFHKLVATPLPHPQKKSPTCKRGKFFFTPTCKGGRWRVLWAQYIKEGHGQCNTVRTGRDLIYHTPMKFKSAWSGILMQNKCLGNFATIKQIAIEQPQLYT